MRLTKDSSKHRAAVISSNTIFYGNGTTTPALPNVGSSLLLLLEGTTGRFTDHCTIIVDDIPLSQLTGHQDIATAGWRQSKMDAWTIFHRPDNGRTVSLGLRRNMGARHYGALFTADTDPGVLALLLDRYHQATGNPWRGTPSMSALNAIRLTWGNPAYQPLWRLPKECVRPGVGPIFWTRPLTELEKGWGYVHTFDGNNAYLGSAISADLAWSKLHHVGPQVFDPGLPGYWLLSLPNSILGTLRDPLRPPLLGRKVRDTCAWMTTPYAKFLARYGQCDVIDSMTARAEYRDDGRRIHPAGARILRRWAETIRDTLPEAPQAVAPAVKRTYKNAFGAMQSETGRIYRPDHTHTIQDLWRATLLTRIERIREEIGYWPVRIATDSISYADSNPDPAILAAHVGAQMTRPYRLGNLHYEATHTTDQWIAAHETRRQKVGAR